MIPLFLYQQIVCLADKYCAVVESMFKHSRVAAAQNANGEYDEW